MTSEMFESEKKNDTGILEEARPSTERMQDWLTDPEKYLQEIENAEILIDRLLTERDSLLDYIRALRFWAYEVIGGSVNLNDQPKDMLLLEAMMNLPEYLRKEIRNST